MNEHVRHSNERSGLDSRVGQPGTGSVYFIGIGGIGMSAIARYFHSKGFSVSGYDKTPTDLTKELEAAGITVYYDEDVNRIPKHVELVVYTPAVPDDHAELVYYRQHNYKVVKRSDALQQITMAPERDITMSAAE